MNYKSVMDYCTIILHGTYSFSRSLDVFATVVYSKLVRYTPPFQFLCVFLFLGYIRSPHLLWSTQDIVRG